MEYEELERSSEKESLEDIREELEELRSLLEEYFVLAEEFAPAEEFVFAEEDFGLDDNSHSALLNIDVLQV
jgi:hypothetical protein